MTDIVPWKVWGRYEDEATKDDDDHQVAHVDFGFIVYEYEDQKRVFDVKQIHDIGGVVQITASEMGKPKIWTFTFTNDPKPGTVVNHWVLSHDQNSAASLKDNLPMTEKYWVLRFGMWPVLGVNAVLWVGLLFLLYLWYENS